MGRTAVVTGANGGIGSAICRALAARGDVPIGLDVQPQGIGDWRYHPCDLSDVDAVQSIFTEILATGEVDVLVNNAGHYHAKTFFDIDLADFDRTMAVNVRAAFLAIKLVAPGMMKRGRGQVINITSLSAHTGSLVTDYGASKAAIIGLTKSLAKTLGPSGVCVNAVAPGFTDTAMVRRGEPEMVRRTLEAVPLKRAGQPEEIASLVAFLASDGCGYVNGAVLDANGGVY